MGDDYQANELDLSKYYQKTCLICFKEVKNTKEMFELWLTDGEQITLLEKLQSFSQENLWANDCNGLCDACLKDLNNAYQFRTRLAASQEFWRNALNANAQKSDGFIVPNSNLDNENLKVEELTEDSLTYFTCNGCNVLFTNSDEFSLHKCLNTASVKEPKALSTNSKASRSCVCDLCGKKFKDVNGKNNHKIKVHLLEKIFPCTFCDKSFKQKYHLKEHLTSHTGEKNYPCSICNKIFQRISSQRRHMKTHERSPGEKTKQTPFLCTVCGKTFPYSNGVQRHLRIHTGEKNFECNICGKKFVQSTHLQVHLRTHTGEKPYMCNFCGESFALNAALQKHIVNSHPTGHC